MVKKRVSPEPIDLGHVVPVLKEIANCLAYLVINTTDLKDKSNNDRIPVLARLAFDRQAIASLLETTPGTVSVRLSQVKTSSKASGQRKPKIAGQEPTSAGTDN